MISTVARRLLWLVAPPWSVSNNTTTTTSRGKSRVVKRSSDLRTSNFKFLFVFLFHPFDIRIQASLIRCRGFCLESGALLLQWCTVWRFLCSLLAVNSSDARHVFAYPSPPLPAYRHGVQLLFVLHCALGGCYILMKAIKVTNLGGPDTEQTSNANCLSFSTNI